MEQAHHLQHAAEADLHEKGLSANSVGVLGSVVLGISSVAPAYALTATIGILVTQAGTKMAVVIIAGFLPMFFAAYAYRELNKVVPDCGTSFTWTTKAFGPYVGWLGGWAAVLATAIVLSNLAGVAVEFFYQFLGDLFGNESLGALWENPLINVLTCLAFLFVATWVAYRGITTTERVQFVLVGFQLAMLGLFAVLAISKSGSSATGMSFSWDWFSPAGLTLSAFIAGLSGSIFAFWGWDTCLTVNEESKGSAKTPGRAALLCVLSILLTYLIVATASQMFAGTGEEGVGLGNPDNASNVFAALAEPVLGNPWQLLLYLAVLASSTASLITTFLPSSRTMLGMAAYGALPARFASIHPRYLTPSYATVAAGVVAGAFYTVMHLLSRNALMDTIYALGIMICFYYGLTAFACIWFFRRELFADLNSFVFKLLFPLLGGLGLFAVLIITLRDSASPDYGSGASVFGVGLVLVLGLGLILLGVVLMMVWRSMAPAFFRGETLRTDTPAVIVE
ncbi:APC family permease [Mycolicibacterium sp.]|uniref:APC family permease n=1 Tax=Mycolicibacterium sp. TaxID=2320850 RepID=UPI0028AEF5F3|nr:APC family permease [Mycolicibacterium sp.]